MSTPGSGLAFDSQPNKVGATHFQAPGPSGQVAGHLMPRLLGQVPCEDIKAFPQRPIPILQGTFSSSNAGLVNSDQVLPASLQPHVTNYVGALGFRATICYRLEVAAAPQAQGIVRLCWEPLVVDISHAKSRYRAAIAPMVGSELDLAESASCELRVPYMYPVDFWYLNGGSTPPIGLLTIWPYSPVQWDTTTVSTPSYTLYRWLEDVEYVGRSTTPLVILPQSGIEDEHRPVTKFFTLGERVSSAIAAIPSLTSIALPVSWAMGAAARIAAHYGWSKPSNGSYTGIMGMSLSRGHNTCADADYLQPLAMFANNQVEVMPGFAGSDLDEMAICHLTCRPGLIASFPLLPSDVQGQLKWTTPVNPCCMFFQTAATGFGNKAVQGNVANAAAGSNKLAVIPSPACYVASWFAKWRGDFVFRFRFARTKFHSGKVVIGFLPCGDPWDGTTAGGANIAPSATARYDYHSIIVDLRTTNVAELPVPFTYPWAWCDTGMATYKSGAFAVNSPGVVFMRVIEPLYGPDNVSQSVNVLVEAFADCGIEFSQPIMSQLTPIAPSFSPTMYAQSSMEDNVDACKYSAGERILSIKQLLARPVWRYALTPTGRSTVNEFPLSNYNYSGLHWSSPTTGPALSGCLIPYYGLATNYDSVAHRFSHLFSLWRGSSVVRLMPALTPSSTKANFASSAMAVYLGSYDTRFSGFAVEANMSNQLHLPFYSNTTRVACPWTGSVNPVDSKGVGWSILTNLGGTDSSCLVGVAAGDDFQFGGFSGIPPCVFSEGAVDGYFCNQSSTPP